MTGTPIYDQLDAEMPGVYPPILAAFHDINRSLREGAREQALAELAIMRHIRDMLTKARPRSHRRGSR